MSKKLMELVTKALKKAKVELNDEAKEALSDALGSSSLKDEAGLIELGTNQKVVEESDYTELVADAKKYRKRAQDAEADRDRLKGILDSGDSENKRLADGYKKELDKVKPLAETLMKRSREDWARKSELIPADKADAKDDEKKRVAKIRERFVFPEKDKELSDEQILSNLTKFDELSDLGVLTAAPATTKPNGGGGGPKPPRGNPGAGGEHKSEDVADDYVNFYETTDPARPVGNAR